MRIKRGDYAANGGYMLILLRHLPHFFILLTIFHCRAVIEHHYAVFPKKKSLRQFAEANGKGSACYNYVSDFEKANPEAAYFFDLKFGGQNGTY